MKNFLLLPGVALLLCFKTPPHPDHFCGYGLNDTSHILHVMDGVTNEWPDSLFQFDKETSARYAIDNDAHQLYLALRISDFRTQMKLMRQGMNLYIDLKGKRKEGRSIEFPLKSQDGEGYAAMNAQQGSDQHAKFDKKAFREAMALHLLGMKLVGFGDVEPTTQGLSTEGSANIGFTWDSADVMHIEYKLPFSMLAEGNSLDQKTISVGWKINGIEQTTNNNTVAYTTTSVQGRPAGAGGPRGNSRGPGSSSDPFAGTQQGSAEQSYGTKYTIHL